MKLLLLPFFILRKAHRSGKEGETTRCNHAVAGDPRPNGCKKLKGRDAYRIRSGNYRIIYDIQDNELIIDVIALGHRKDVYK